MTTLRELIKGSMRLINVIGTSEEPTADDMTTALEAMDGLVQSMGNDILNIYTVQPHLFPLTPGKQHYTLGPALDESGALTGADWVIKRPMRIEQARLLLYPSISFASEDDGNGGGGGGGGAGCSTFTYEFGVPNNPFELTYETLLNWPTTNLWFFRVYPDATSGNLGAELMVTIDATEVTTVGEFKASVEAQLPGFSLIIDGKKLHLSRPGATFAMLDGNGAVWPNEGSDWGVWNFTAFYVYTDNNSVPRSAFGEVLPVGTCYTEYIGPQEPDPEPPPVVQCEYNYGLGWSVTPEYTSAQELPNPTPYAGFWTKNSPMFTVANDNRTVTLPVPDALARVDVGSRTYRTTGKSYFEIQQYGSFETYGIMTGQVAEVGSTLPTNELADGVIITLGYNELSSTHFLWIRKWTNGSLTEYSIDVPGVTVIEGDYIGFIVNHDAGKIQSIKVSNTEVVPANLSGAALVAWNQHNSWEPNAPTRILAQVRANNPANSISVGTDYWEQSFGYPADVTVWDCNATTP